MSFTANRPIEHQSGSGGQNSGGLNGSGGGVAQFPRVVTGASAPAPAGNVTWRNPNIFQQIQAAGQTVVSVNVFTVQANNPNWTPSGVTLAAGQHLWIDTQAIGLWNGDPEDAPGPGVDANGNAGAIPQDVVPVLPNIVLAGRIGTGGIPFAAGDTQTNYAPSGTGTLSMIMNDTVGDFGDNTGAQMGRVIVVQ